MLAEVGGLLDDLLHGEGEADGDFVDDLTVQDLLQVIDHAQQRPLQHHAVVGGISLEMADDHQAEVRMPFDQVGKCLCPSVCAQDEHVPDVPPVVSSEDQDFAHNDADSYRRGGERREYDDE